MTVSGIDISSYQNETYSTAGLGFVLIKVTEGTGYLNPKYAAQLAHARAANVVPGHYHFVRPGDMTVQADYFLKHATVKAGDILAFDWEDTGVTGAQKDAWIKYVQGKMPHNCVILYCNKDFWLNRDKTSFAGDGLWIADPNAVAGKPGIQHAWVMHQYSEAGGLDHDVANFASVAALKIWAAKGTTTTTPSEEDDMALTDAEIQKIAAAVWNEDIIPAARPPYQNSDYKTNPTWQAKYAVQTNVEGARTAAAQTAGLLAAIQTLASKLGTGADTATIVTAVQEAIKDAVVEVKISSQAPATE
jgi:hypothetical protein